MRRRACLLRLALLPLLGMSPLAGAAEVIGGRVVHVGAGDRLKIRTRQRTWEVRIAGVRPPGFEPYDARARSGLARLVLGERVEVTVVDRDAEGRADLRGHASHHGQDLAAALVAEGLLRADRRRPVPPGLLEREAEARAAGRGLWADVRSAR